MNNDNPTVPSAPDSMTEAEKADHERSVHDYPNIQFSPTEYVVIDVERSLWGLARIWFYALLTFIAMSAILILIDNTSPVSLNNMVEFSLLVMTAALPMVMGLIGTWVYRRNHYIVTNERIYSHIQYSPFAKRMQIIEIDRIEDCSYLQSNIIQIFLNFGSIRLSTVGDEQTYIFSYAARPKEQFRTINYVIQQVNDGQPTKYKKY